MFSLQQNRRRIGWNRFCLEGGKGVRGRWHKQCIHVSKYKMIKGEKKKKEQAKYLSGII
jgi:hypothetical protein